MQTTSTVSFFNVGSFSSQTDKFIANVHCFEILSLCGLSRLGKCWDFWYRIDGGKFADFLINVRVFLCMT